MRFAAMAMVLVLVLVTLPTLAAQAGMQVKRGDKNVNSGSTDRMTQTGDSPFQLIYTIQSTGASDLLLTDAALVLISDEHNCVVTILETPDDTIPAMDQTTFRLQVSPISATAFRFDVSIPNNVPEGSPYTFRFSGHTDVPDSRSRSDSSRCTAGTGPALPVLLLAAALLFRRRREGRAT